MVQPDNWMGERTPASDTCDQPRHERAAVQAPRRVNASGDSQMGARLRVADLHCSALGDRLLEDVVPHLLRSFSQRADHNARADVRLGAQKARGCRRPPRCGRSGGDTHGRRVAHRRRESRGTLSRPVFGKRPAARVLLGNRPVAVLRGDLGALAVASHGQEISPEFRREREVRSGGMKALLTTVPGEQHSFGLLLVSEWFSRAGWAVVPGPFQTDRDIGRAVGAESLTLAGFSVGSETQLDRVAASIAVVRRKSLNPRIGIMVGGPLFNARPELVQRVGADATAVDAAQALAKAEECVADGLWAS